MTRRTFGFSLLAAPACRAAVKERTIVATFDDAPASHFTVVAPLLKKYGFGGSFFVCEFPPDFADKSKYMTWEQMRELDRMGFEVASHTHTHAHVDKLTSAQFNEELQWVEDKFAELKIPKPVSFAYPSYFTRPYAIEVLKQRGYKYGRAGLDRVYDPAVDDPFLMPSLTMHDNNKQQIIDFVEQARDGKIAVLTIHGVPDIAHPWVNTPPALFEEHLAYWKQHGFRVIAMRDLGRS